MHEKTSTIRLLVNFGADINGSVSTAVFENAHPSLPRLKDVIALEGSVLPLEVATRVLNCLNMTRLLLDLGADPNIRKKTPDGTPQLRIFFKIV